MLGDTVANALQNARADGDLRGEALLPDNTSMFIDHIGTMMSAIHALSLRSRPYRGSTQTLVREAVWFCCRGIGFTDEAIARHIDDS